MGRFTACLTPHGLLKQTLDQRQRLIASLAIRQCLLELRHAFVDDLRPAKAQQSEVGQSFDVLEEGVGDLGRAAAAVPTTPLTAVVRFLRRPTHMQLTNIK